MRVGSKKWGALSPWVFLAFASGAAPALAQQPAPAPEPQASAVGCEPAPEGDRTLRVGACVRSTIDERDQLAGRARFEDYGLRLAPGQAVQIDMDAVEAENSADPAQGQAVQTRYYGFDTVLEVRRTGQTEPLAVNDDRPGSLNSRIVFVAGPEGGDYVVRARALGSGTGDYLLRVTEAAPPSPPQPFEGNSVTGTLGAVGADGAQPALGIETFLLEGRAGERIRLIMTTGSQLISLRLLNAESAAVAGGIGFGDGRVELITVLPADGRYLVQVSAEQLQGPAPFTVNLERGMGPATRPAPRPIVLGQTIPGRLGVTSAGGAFDPGSDRTDFFYDLYQIRVEAGRPLVISLSAEDGVLDPIVEVGTLGPQGFAVLAADDDSGPGYNSRLAFTPPESGVLIVRARGFLLMAGSYRLTVAPDTPPPPAQTPAATPRR